jgi:quercetin dioxygenase-like cupin family protein
MKTRTKIAIGVTAAVVMGIAFATPIVNLASPLISVGTHEFAVDVNGAFPVEGGYFRVNLTTNRPSAVETQISAYAVGGENGWHSHPGLVAVTITSGTIEWYSENCHVTTYTAGDSWFEGSQPHMFKNVGTAAVTLVGTFIVSKGATLRIDQPAPACASELGIN